MVNLSMRFGDRSDFMGIGGKYKVGRRKKDAGYVGNLSTCMQKSWVGNKEKHHA